MLLRPATARWFELLTTRDELAPALRSLAGTGQVELQADTDVTAEHLLPVLRAVVDDYKRLTQRYGQYWPAPSGGVRGRVYVLPSTPEALGTPPAVLVKRIPSGPHTYSMALGPADQIAALEDRLSARKAHRVDIPEDLPPRREDALAEVKTRQTSVDQELRQLERQLARLHEAHQLPAVLADLGFTEWLVGHVPELATTEHFAWITGWTSDHSGARIESALGSANVGHLLRFPVVLFEFCIRFLRGTGRPFRPLPQPTAATKHL